MDIRKPGIAVDKSVSQSAPQSAPQEAGENTEVVITGITPAGRQRFMDEMLEDVGKMLRVHNLEAIIFPKNTDPRVLAAGILRDFPLVAVEIVGLVAKEQENV